MEALILFLGAIALIVGLVIYNTFSWGFVCFKFWWWFILPVFPDLPHLNFWQCVGIMFFISLFRNNTTESTKKDSDNKYSGITSAMTAPWVSLLVAYFFH